MTYEKTLENLLLKNKPVYTIIVLYRGESYASQISDEIDTTYAHTIDIISKLKELEIVQSKKKGRKKIISLTDEGEEIAGHLENLINTIDDKTEESITNGEKKASSKNIEDQNIFS